jgi:hypothetical protein
VTVTYGERMLAGVEGKRRRVMAKRRALTLLVPSLIASGWSTSALIATRNERLATEGAGLLRLIADPALPVLWTALFVLLPLWWALKPEPLPAGAGLAFMAGHDADLVRGGRLAPVADRDAGRGDVAGARSGSGARAPVPARSRLGPVAPRARRAQRRA